jgi:hypothetical protein
MARDDDASLGPHFWRWFLGIGLVAVAGCVLIFLLIHGAWAKWGAFGTLLFFFAVILVVAWFYDRRQVKSYGEEY